MTRLLNRSGTDNWFRAFSQYPLHSHILSSSVDNQFHAVVFARICANNKHKPQQRNRIESEYPNALSNCSQCVTLYLQAGSPLID